MAMYRVGKAPKVNPEAELAVKLAAEGYCNRALSDKPARNPAQDAAKLCSIARALRRLYTEHCNRELSAREILRMKSLERAVEKLLLEGYDLKSEHNRDPRGYAIYIHFPDGSSNSWGGSERGWGI